LGLTITKVLTEAMGGDIAVRSTPGFGSCFTVRLMLSPVPATKRVREGTRQPIVGYEGARRTVLVVDDDPNHIAFVRDALSALGFAVMTETSGRGCLDAAARANADALLLDISMPGMDGWETAKHLRESALARMPIIMISADARLESKREEAALYHDAYLMKPLRLLTLLDTLKQLLDLRWVYNEHDPRAPLSLSLGELSAEQIPSQKYLATLSQLGAIGHVRGILAQLDEVGTVEPSAAPVLAYLRRLAEDCDLDGYQDAIEALISHAV
jgi:CheY-like chemotaxis protein